MPLDDLKIAAIGLYGFDTFLDIITICIFIWLFKYFYQMKKILLSDNDESLTCHDFMNLSLVILIVLLQIGESGLKMTEPFITADDVCQDQKFAILSFAGIK